MVRSMATSTVTLWRDGRLWMALSLSAAVVVTGLIGVGINVSGLNSALISAYVVGLVVSIVGVVVQQWRVVPGIAIAGAGMVLQGVSAVPLMLVGYLLVCYEAYAISARIRTRRAWWLAALVVGSYAAIVWAGVVNLWLVSTSPVVSLEEQRENVANGLRDPGMWIVTVVTALLIAVSIALMWTIGRNSLRKAQEIEALVARAELATVSERNRIAREMHDIVAHSLTAIIAQADGGRYAGRKDAAKAMESLDIIAARGRESLGQMRGLLSVLRDDATTDPRDTASTPGVSGIPALVADARRNGVHAAYTVAGEPGPLDEVRGLTVYRIVQEALTNVLKHAGGVEATVAVEWSEDSLRVQVDNAPGEQTLEGSGRGLTGIKERVRIVGGTAWWGPSEVYPGGWCVRAEIRR